MTEVRCGVFLQLYLHVEILMTHLCNESEEAWFLYFCTRGEGVRGLGVLYVRHVQSQAQGPGVAIKDHLHTHPSFYPTMH